MAYFSLRSVRLDVGGCRFTSRTLSDRQDRRSRDTCAAGKPLGDEHPAAWYVSALLAWGCDARMRRTNRPSPFVSRNPVMSSAVIRGMMPGLGGETGVHSLLVTCISPHEGVVYTVRIRRAWDVSPEHHTRYKPSIKHHTTQTAADTFTHLGHQVPHTSNTKTTTPLHIQRQDISRTSQPPRTRPSSYLAFTFTFATTTQPSTCLSSSAHLLLSARGSSLPRHVLVAPSPWKMPQQHR
jgi:hypothetical protein